MDKKKKVKLQDNNNNKKYRQWCRSSADSAREPVSMGSIFTAGFDILLLLLRTNWILRSLNKMIKDKEMKEILDEMSVVFTMMRMRKKKKKERTGRSMEEND